MNEEWNTNVAQEPENGKKQGKKKWVSLLITIVILSVVGTIGEKMAGNLSEKFTVNKNLKQIEQYAKQAKEYVPGTLTDDAYISEYWDLKFQTNDQWFMNEELRKEMSAEVYQSGKAALTASLQDEEFPQEIIEASQNSFYAASEMLAVYTDEKSFGTAELRVLQSFGVDQTYEDTLLNTLMPQKDTEISEIAIGENKYTMFTVALDANGMSIQRRGIIITKGVSFCMLLIDHPVGDDYIFDSFMEQLSPCH